MIERIFKHVIESYRHRFVSRRLILFIDLILVSLSFLIACGLRFNLDLALVNWGVYKYYLLVLVAVRLVCFIILKSFHGIVRHTSLEDISLIFRTVSISSLIVMASSVTASYIFNLPALYIPVSVLMIEYFVCLFIMISTRVFVKSIYKDINQAAYKGGMQEVVIYGAGSLGITTKSALLKDGEKNYDILCFIDDNELLTNSTIQGIKVLSREQAVQKYIHGREGKVEIILAIQHLGSARKKEILEYFLQRDVVVKVVPTINEWLNGILNSRQIRKIRIEDLLGRDPIRLDNSNVSYLLIGKSVLITGAAGSIGSEIASQVLRYKPARLVLLDQSETGLYELGYELEKIAQKFKLQETTIDKVVCDVTDEKRLRGVFEASKPDLVFHAAAYKHVPLMENQPYEAIKVNVLGTQLVADVAMQSGVDRFVFVSTDKAVNPTNVMGATKRLAEMYIEGLNKDQHIGSTRYVITRFGNVLGSNGSVVPLFQKQIREGGPITVTHPDVIRYFMTIPEACQLVLEAGAMGDGGEVFVFDMGEPIKIADLAQRMIQLSDLEPGKDIAIHYTGLRPGEKLFEELLADNEQVLSTHHPKIKIAKLRSIQPGQVNEVISALKLSLEKGDKKEMVGLLKVIVTEYKSNNSEFELLDQEMVDLGEVY